MFEGHVENVSHCFQFIHPFIHLLSPRVPELRVTGLLDPSNQWTKAGYPLDEVNYK